MCAVAEFFKFEETNPRFVYELVCVSHRVQNIAWKARCSGMGEVSDWRGIKKTFARLVTTSACF